MKKYKAFISGYNGKYQYNFTKDIIASNHMEACFKANSTLTSDTETCVVKYIGDID